MAGYSFKATDLQPQLSDGAYTPPLLDFYQSTTGSGPKPNFGRMNFQDGSGSGVSVAFLQVTLPDDYDSGTAPHMILDWFSSANDGGAETVGWYVLVAKLGVDDDVLGVTFDAANGGGADVPTTAGQMAQFDITLNNMDGAAAEDSLIIAIVRDQTATDDHDHDVYLKGGFLKITLT